MSNKQIGIIVGSLRKGSFNKKIANFLVKNAPNGYSFELIEIGQLPLYNQDFDEPGQAPETYQPFRDKIKSLQGVIFVTPEYNRSIPAALKNALDVASRPYGQNAWDGKPALVVSSSIGGLSGFGANHHLRQSLTFLNMPTLQQPEVYVAHSGDLFDDEDNLTNERTATLLQTALGAYITFLEKVSA